MRIKAPRSFLAVITGLGLTVSCAAPAPVTDEEALSEETSAVEESSDKVEDLDEEIEGTLASDYINGMEEEMVESGLERDQAIKIANGARKAVQGVSLALADSIDLDDPTSFTEPAIEGAMKAMADEDDGINKDEDKEKLAAAIVGHGYEFVQDQADKLPKEKRQELRKKVLKKAVASLEDAGLPQKKILDAASKCFDRAMEKIKDARVSDEADAEADEAIDGMMDSLFEGLEENEVSETNTVNRLDDLVENMTASVANAGFKAIEKLEEVTAKVVAKTVERLDRLGIKDEAKIAKAMGNIAEGASDGLGELKKRLVEKESAITLDEDKMVEMASKANENASKKLIDLFKKLEIPESDIDEASAKFKERYAERFADHVDDKTKLDTLDKKFDESFEKALAESITDENVRTQIRTKKAQAENLEREDKKLRCLEHQGDWIEQRTADGRYVTYCKLPEGFVHVDHEDKEGYVAPEGQDALQHDGFTPKTPEEKRKLCEEHGGYFHEGQQLDDGTLSPSRCILPEREGSSDEKIVSESTDGTTSADGSQDTNFYHDPNAQHHDGENHEGSTDGTQEHKVEMKLCSEFGTVSTILHKLFEHNMRAEDFRCKLSSQDVCSDYNDPESTHTTLDGETREKPTLERAEQEDICRIKLPPKQ